HVRALVLEPTRELAVQAAEELQSFSASSNTRTCVLYGGASMANQIRELKIGADIVVGTPGRIIDHIERGTLDLRKIDFFILDEGDEMLDMGFIDDIEHIFEQAKPDARILLFSATIPEPILKIAQKFMGEYEIVEEESSVSEPLLIEQKYWILRESEKIDALVRLIDFSDDFYGLVFTQTKVDADNVTRMLDERGYEAASLHGDIMQSQREKVLARFRKGKTRILVATDVAARGIDISGLSHVVNYSLPFDSTTYVHRIGRTGRAGRTGFALTFVRPDEIRKLKFMLRRIQKSTHSELQESNCPSVEEVLEKKKEHILNFLKQNITTKNKNDSFLENSFAENTLSENISSSDFKNLSSADIVKEQEAFAEKQSETIGASFLFEEMADKLCKENDAKEVLVSVLSVMYKNELDEKRYGKISSHQQGNHQGNIFDKKSTRFSKKDGVLLKDQLRLYVQLGRRDGIGPRELADYFSELLHIPGKFIDRIDMSSNFSLLSLPVASAKKALELSKSNSNIPHMHIDSKSFSSHSLPYSKFNSSSNAKQSKGRNASFAKLHDNFSNKLSKRNVRYGDQTKINIHTATERNSKAGLYRKKMSERF
ncbi:MAG: DEAD/DEAH box helicase, partial [Treponema sp.]|nr:DEAD/DEAH box helicase [Treponema sp.]